MAEIHKVGIRHNQATNESHYLYGRDGRIRVVDFSQSEKHKCQGASPLLETSVRPKLGHGCLELEVMESVIGRIETGRLPVGK